MPHMRIPAWLKIPLKWLTLETLGNFLYDLLGTIVRSALATALIATVWRICSAVPVDVRFIIGLFVIALVFFGLNHWVRKRRSEQQSLTVETTAAIEQTVLTTVEQAIKLPLPAPNIVCLGEGDLFVELSRHEVFRQSANIEHALRAITAEFRNEPKLSQKVGTAANVAAQISYFSLDWPDRLEHRTQFGCWLNEELPHVSFGLNTTHQLILGIFEPGLKGGFKPNFRIYGSSLDKDVPLSRLDYSNYQGFGIKVQLVVGEHGEFSAEYDFELRIMIHDNSYTSYTFEYLTERKRQERRQRLARQFKQFITDGERFILEPKDVIDWNRFCSEANQWRYKVEETISKGLGRPFSIRFLDVNKLPPYPQVMQEGGKRFLDELRVQHDNLKEIAKEHESSFCAEISVS